MPVGKHPRLFLLAVLLLLAPTFIFALDQLGVTIPGDSLTLSLVMVGAGGLAAAASQREAGNGRVIAALLTAVVVAAAQLFAISAFALN